MTEIEQQDTATANAPALETRALHRNYGNVEAARDVTLRVPTGACLGMVGPNGAGKTTTLSMMTGLVRPTSGQAFVRGNDVWRQPKAAQALLGVVPDRVRLFDRLTGRQLLVHAGLLRGVSRTAARTRADSLLAALELTEDAHRVVSDWSIGMRRKVSLGAALMHAPEVLVLDEPFESVDPVSTESMIDMLATFRQRGGTVVFSSHSLGLVERISTHVAIVNHGRVALHEPIEALGHDGEPALRERYAEIASSDKPEMEWLWPSQQ